MADSCIVVNIIKHNKIIKQINESVNFKSNNIDGYITLLRKIQKDTNVLLTELVNLENGGDSELTGDQTGDDEDSEDDDLNAIPKRKFQDAKDNRKKLKK